VATAPSHGAEGPVVFQVTDVPVGDGPELTGANLVSNPSGWEGSVTVDVSNSDHTVTIATEDSDVFETATVTTAGRGTVSLVSDNLWTSERPSALTQGGPVDDTTTTLAATMPLSLNSDPGTATMAWTSSEPGTSWNLTANSAAVFAFAVTQPTMTITTEAPTTTAPPAAAKAVQATPAFTG
jgi:hypothetical protein